MQQQPSSAVTEEPLLHQQQERANEEAFYNCLSCYITFVNFLTIIVLTFPIISGDAIGANCITYIFWALSYCLGILLVDILFSHRHDLLIFFAIVFFIGSFFLFNNKHDCVVQEGFVTNIKGYYELSFSSLLNCHFNHVDVTNTSAATMIAWEQATNTARFNITEPCGSQLIFYCQYPKHFVHSCYLFQSKYISTVEAHVQEDFVSSLIMAVLFDLVGISCLCYTRLQRFMQRCI
jgi:hypothetical protein